MSVSDEPKDIHKISGFQAINKKVSNFFINTDDNQDQAKIKTSPSIFKTPIMSSRSTNQKVKLVNNSKQEQISDKEASSNLLTKKDQPVLTIDSERNIKT